MDEEARFLAAIRSSPHDDAARLVYADWLSERGDPRGEFIIAQCTRHRLVEAGDHSSEAYRHATTTEARVLTPARKAWFAWLGIKDRMRSGFERGLPAVLQIDRSQLAELASRLAQLPLQAITIPCESAPPKVAELRAIMALPGFSDLDELEFTHSGAVFGLEPKKLALALEDPRLPEEMDVHQPSELLPHRAFDDACVEIWHSANQQGELNLRVQRTDRLPHGLEVFGAYTSQSRLPAFIEALGLERRTMKRFGVTFARDEPFTPLFEAWSIDGLRKLALTGVYGPEATHDTRPFLTNQVGKGLESFDTTIPLDDHVATGLAEARLGELSAHGGGSLDALGRILDEHPIHTLSLRGFPSAALVDLLVAKAPPTLSMLTIAELDSADVLRLAIDRFAGLTRLWIQMGPNEAPKLLTMPALREVPWIHCGRTNRTPGPNASPYEFRRPRR